MDEQDRRVASDGDSVPCYLHLAREASKLYLLGLFSRSLNFSL